VHLEAEYVEAILKLSRPVKRPFLLLLLLLLLLLHHHLLLLLPNPFVDLRLWKA
jgi:hypothetical protein